MARLATVGADGRPHLVPVTFAVDGDEILSAVDGKPKTSRNLRRLANIGANPAVTLLVDHYEDDWDALWWVRADGVARVEYGDEVLVRARAALATRYAQYRTSPPDGPVVLVRVTRWRGWSAR